MDLGYKIIAVIAAIFAIASYIYSIWEKKLSIKEKLEKNPEFKKLFKKENQNFYHAPYLRMLFLAISTFISGYLIKQVFFTKSGSMATEKIRIVVLMPTDSKVRAVYQDGLRQLDGFAEYINKNDQKCAFYEFIPLSHANDTKIAKDIVIKEIKQGTKYFISTMSMVDEELSKDWSTILKECNVDTLNNPPRLICTVASSPEITPRKDMVYRFYIRSSEECKALVSFAKQPKFKRAFCIVVADNYGNGALKEFKTNLLSGTGQVIQFVSSVSLKNDLTFVEIKKAIEDGIMKYNPGQNDAIFVAHYGNGLDNIVKALFELNIKSTLFSSSPLSIPDWQEPIKNELHQMDWYTCFPAYTTPESAVYDKAKNDVIKNFTTFTMAGLVFTLDKLRNDPNSTFYDSWQGAFGDMDFQVTRDKDDFVIPLIVVGKDFFKK